MKKVKVAFQFIAIVIAISFIACKKNSTNPNSTNPNSTPTPTITGINPTYGGYGDTITLTGTNFDTITSNICISNSSSLGVGSCANVIAISASQIKFIVPTNWGSGNIIYTNMSNNKKDTGSLFTYLTSYVCGYSDNYAILWKDGGWNKLTNGSYPACAYSMCTSGNDIYIAGYEKNSSNKSVAKIWKNSIATALTDGTKSAVGYSVFVNGNDVYVAGYEESNIVNAAGTYNKIAKCWKDGVATNLTDGTNESVAKSIFVNNGNVYVVGYQWQGSKYIAMLWINAKATNLSDGTNFAMANSVFVSGNNVYVAGYDGGSAKLWLNGIESTLTGGVNANSVIVNGNGVFVAGAGNSSNNVSVAKFWKDGVATSLSNGNSAASSNSIFVYGKNVYNAGQYSNVQYAGSQSGLGAFYWVNNKLWSQLTSNQNSLNGGVAYSIIVK